MKRYPGPFLRRVCLGGAIGLTLLAAACAVQTKPVYTRDGKRYGVTSGYIWRPTWWNHYERGLSYAEGRYWDEATQDLEEAIRLRADDRRRARTYGMHFVDYFPHRELGVILFRLDRHQDAIDQLEQSLSTEASAKAEYYLNRARKAWLEKTGRDLKPPTIRVTSPPQGFITRNARLILKGNILDDQYVSAISVEGKALPVFLAKQQIPLEYPFSLRPGLNRIRIEARDLTGKQAQSEIEVLMDPVGPLLFLAPPRPAVGPAGTLWRITGEARDRVGVARMTVNGESLEQVSGKEVRFDRTMKVPSSQARLEVEVEDVAGNITHGFVQIPWGEASPKGQSVYLACLDGALPALPALGSWTRPALISEATLVRPSPSGPGPRIRLRDLPETTLTVYYESLYVEGSVSGPDPIRQIEINGEELLDGQGRNIFFSCLVDLKEGENLLQVSAVDTRGKTDRTTSTVLRKVPRILSLSGRMRLSLVPFPATGGRDETVRMVTEQLLVALIRQRRFHMVERERLADVLQELKIASSRLTDEETAVRVGRLVAAEGVVMGAVLETSHALEVVARIVDTETSRILLTRDAFSEDSSPGSMNAMMEALAYRLKQGIPLVEGAVVRSEDEDHYVNFGSRSGVLEGQKLIFFREGPEIHHPVTGLFLGREPETLAEGTVQDIQEEMSVVRTHPKTIRVKIQPSDQVITK